MESRKKIIVKHRVGEYPLFLGESLLDDQGILLAHCVGREVVLINDQKIAYCHLLKVKNCLLDNSITVHNIPIDVAEADKDIKTFMSIIDQLAQLKQARDTTLIAFGGGVTGDIVGFVAACYLRGVAYIQIPTTLLSQVDSSIGGKTAINHPCGKNMIGAFYQPRAVIIDTHTLDSLPKREFNAGIAEIIKAALIQDADFFCWLQQNISALLAREQATLLYAIERACYIKRSIVEQDETEKGLRALLNLGHTFAHAIEQQLGYGYWLHGEAVAVGLILAAKLSLQLGLLTETECSAIQEIIKQCQLPSRLPNSLKYATLLSAMRSDKKVQNNKLRFVLNKGIGSAIIRDDVPEALLRDVIESQAGVQDELHTTTTRAVHRAD